MAAPSSMSSRGYSLADGVATIVMPTPSLTLATKEWLRDTLAAAGQDDAARAVVLTGAGRTFCVGQDLREHAQALAADAGSALNTLQLHYEPIVQALTTMPKPVVAAINGACVGAGLSFALACDVRLARAGSTLGTAFTAIGLSFDSGLSATLPRAVGSARASELIMLGEPFSAEQACDWGLVGQVVDVDRWDDAVAEVAGKLANGPTRAYASAKAALVRQRNATFDDVLVGERAEQQALGLTADHRNAVDAFLAKRRPEFTGRS